MGAAEWQAGDNICEFLPKSSAMCHHEHECAGVGGACKHPMNSHGWSVHDHQEG